jgi:mannose-6-phosphate isomerase-like protein (cupin superfamily)
LSILLFVTGAITARHPTRRVVAAQDASGRSRVIGDAEVGAHALESLPGQWLSVMWADRGTPELPVTADSVPDAFPMMPTPGGFSFMVFTIEPDAVVAGTVQRGDDAIAANEFLRYADEGNPRMHGSDNATFLAILSGEIWIELDGGEEFHLRAGDTYVQLGVRKSYWNRGDVPCRMAVASVGGRRVAANDSR